MNTAATTKFAVKPLAMAVALAVSAGAAFAAPTPLQLPGAGTVTQISLGSLGTNFGGVGAPIVGLGVPPANNGIGIDGKVVITWGGVGAPFDPVNPAGFNIGSSGKLQFGAISAGSAVLNIDASGNLSQIYGTLESTALPFANCGGCGFAPAMFIANGNGIIVSGGGRIAAPTGIGLIGADLNNATAKNDFVANNGWVVPNPPTLGTSYLDVSSIAAPNASNGVTIAGAINGSLTLNQPAFYILVTGNNITNTGNLFATQVFLVSGLIPTTATDNVNGIPLTPVNRLWNVDSGTSFAPNGNLGTTPGTFSIGAAGSNLLNTGSVSAVGGFIYGAATGNLRTGTLGNTDLTLGMFSDAGIFLDTYSATSKMEVYNVVRGYTTGVTLPFFDANVFVHPAGDVTINALTAGSEPSSITTTGSNFIRGANVNINSTINSTVNPISFGSLFISSSNSTTITAAIGAGDNVSISNSGAGGINITGSILSDLENLGLGGIYITNSGSNAPTTLTNVTVDSRGAGGFNPLNLTVNGPLTITGSNLYTEFANDINITNNKNGAATSIQNTNIVTDRMTVVGSNNINLTVTGPLDVNAFMSAGYDINITNNHLNTTTTIAGLLLAGNDININNNGNTVSKLYVDATAIANDVNVFSGGDLRMGPTGAFNDINLQANGLNVWLTDVETALDSFNFFAPNARTQVWTKAVLSSPTMNIAALNFTGVQNGGAAYTSVGQKPATQLNVDVLNLTMYGSFNAPITGNTNWLLNQIQATPYTAGSPVFASISAVGGGVQAINLGVTGSLVVDSGNTLTPFFLVGFVSPVIIPPILVGNGGSSLLVHATQNIDINAGFVPGLVAQFLFPGGVAAKADTGYLSINAPINNAWTFQAVPYQGQWFEAPTIIDAGYHATNANSFINYSSYPVTGPGNAYVIQQPLPGLFQFVPFAGAIHYNVYSTAILGAPLCNMANPAPPWPPAGC